jgi:hypothetical protein
MIEPTEAILKRIRLLLVLFIAGLIFSGLTAFALESEMTYLLGLLPGPTKQNSYGDFYSWIHRIATGLRETNEKFPFMAYGTDWLAFAHLILAILFVGPFMNPVRNKWVITFGLMSCLLVIPLALICGNLRGVPLCWQLIDCSFGVIGLAPLWMIRRYTARLESKVATN